MEALLNALARTLLPFRSRDAVAPRAEPRAAAVAPTPSAPPLANWVHLPIMLAALVAGYAVARVAWPHLERPTVYTDILVGLTTHDGMDKNRDFRVMWAFLATAAASALLLRAVGRGLARHGGDDVWQAYGALLTVALLPALYRLGLALVGGAHLLGPMAETGAGLVAILLVCGGVWRWRRELTGADLREIVGCTLCALVIGALGAAGLVMVRYRLSPGSLADMTPQRAETSIYGGVVFAAIGVALILLTARAPAAVTRRLCRWVLVLQAALPLLYAVLLPSPIVFDTGAIPGRYRKALLVGMGVLAAASLVSLWRRHRDLGARREWSLRAVLSPWCLSAVVLVFGTATVGLPRLHGDDFHYGESIVPWQQVRDFGQLPYRDFTPIFGSALWVSALDRVFYSGTLETWEQSWTLVHGVAAVLVFLAVWWYAGPWVACLVGVLAETAVQIRIFLWLPALLVLAHPDLLSRPRRWLLAWLAMCPVLVTFNPSYGCSTVLATVPVAMVMAWRLGRNDFRGLVRLAVGVGAVAGVALAVPAIRGMVTGYVRFVATQAAGNDILWGIPWEHSFGRPGSHGIFASPAGYFAWELIRFGWVPLSIVLAAIAWSELRCPAAERDVGRFVLATTTCASILAASGYLAGRIDPGGMMRPGPVTLLLLQVWLAIELMRSRSVKTAVVAATVLVVVFGGLRMWGRTEPTVESIAARALHNRPVNAATLGHLVPVNGAELGCPKMGRVFAEPQHVALFRAFRKEIDALLRPDETFLNLTTNNAWYYYCGRKLPTQFSSYFYAASVDDQLRIVRDFRATMPPVVVIRPSTDFDRGPAARRCYRVFKEVALRYVPVRRPPFLFLIDPSRALPTDPTDHASRVAILDEAYPDADLVRLPEVWGQSWKGLRERFEVAARIDDRRSPDGPWPLPAGDWHTPTSHGPGVSYDLTGLNLRGADADFLALSFEWEPIGVPVTPPGAKPVPPEAALRIDFIAGDQPAAWRFVARCQTQHNGVLLLPLGSRPAWLLAPRLDRMRVTVENVEKCGPFRVSGVTLLRLADGK